MRRRGPGGRGPREQERRRPSESTRASRARRSWLPHAELENGASVGSSTVEVKKCSALSGSLPGGLMRRRNRRGAIGRARRRGVGRPEMTAAPGTDPELIRLPRRARLGVAKVHARAASLAAEHDVGGAHVRIVGDAAAACPAKGPTSAERRRGPAVHGSFPPWGQFLANSGLERLSNLRDERAAH